MYLLSLFDEETEKETIIKFILSENIDDVYIAIINKLNVSGLKNYILIPEKEECDENITYLDIFGSSQFFIIKYLLN